MAFNQRAPLILVNSDKYHTPVMVTEVMDFLDLKPGKIIVDATCGTGGHSLEILKRISPGGRLICIDRDDESLAIAKERIMEFSQLLDGQADMVCDFTQGNFSELDKILDKLNIGKIDGILFDLGVSSYQLENSERGFSFQKEGPLDMRMDRNSYISAYDLVNNLNEEEISNLLWAFGQERWHNRIARFLIEERSKHPISSTQELSKIVLRAIPARYRGYHYRIHPATRTFQAMRIAVNRELESLEIAINKAVDVLNHKARICVISFHSLEDRIVKLAFRGFGQSGELKIITPKPLVPGMEEMRQNPSSRSSKLRAAEKA